MKNESNYIHITSTIYAVKNQNGFNQALYDYMCCENDNEKKKYRKAVQDFPKEYPTIVSFYDEYFECSRIHVDIVKVDSLQIIVLQINKAIDKLNQWQ